MTRPVGLLLIFIGLAVAAVGALAYAGALSWFGRLPGDIRHEGENSRIYVPVVSMLIVSLLLSLAAYLLRRFF
jgi:hypothetical protein